MAQILEGGEAKWLLDCALQCRGVEITASAA